MHIKPISRNLVTTLLDELDDHIAAITYEDLVTNEKAQFVGTIKAHHDGTYTLRDHHTRGVLMPIRLDLKDDRIRVDVQFSTTTHLQLAIAVGL